MLKNACLDSVLLPRRHIRGGILDKLSHSTQSYPWPNGRPDHAAARSDQPICDGGRQPAPVAKYDGCGIVVLQLRILYMRRPGGIRLPTLQTVQACFIFG